jgi:hypothetical protein
MIAIYFHGISKFMATESVQLNEVVDVMSTLAHAV